MIGHPRPSGARPRLTPWLAAVLVICLSACGENGERARRDGGPGADAGVDSSSPVDGGAGDAGDAGPSSTDGGADGAPADAGTDAAPLDAAAMDAGPADTGPADTGPADTGPADTGPADTGPADTGPAPTADFHIHIDVDNFCNMTVTPTEISIPRGQTAYFDWHNHSRDYPVDVWMSYGGGYTDLPTGSTWDEPIPHCGTAFPHTDYADISTACSDHRFNIRCL